MVFDRTTSQLLSFLMVFIIHDQSPHNFKAMASALSGSASQEALDCAWGVFLEMEWNTSLWGLGLLEKWPSLKLT